MTGRLNSFEALIARLAAEPGLSLLAAPDAGVLVWDQAGERLLWASPAAEGLRDAFTREGGQVIPGFRAHARIKALAGPKAGVPSGWCGGCLKYTPKPPIAGT